MQSLLTSLLLVAACSKAAANPPFAGPDGGAAGACLGGPLLSSLGKSNLLMGASMSDQTAAAAAFDARYLYLSGGIFDGAGPCASCASGCASKGHTCANSGGGCAWWGCYQYDQDPPGKYSRDFVAGAKARGEIPHFTYYQILQASGVSEGAPEVRQAANDAAFMSRYFADFRFFLQQIGTGQALIQVEPDFWGYAEQLGSDPHQLSAAVASANAPDCSAEENSVAGLGRCYLAMVRKYAPNAKVGLHGSAWAPGIDALLNKDSSVDIAGEARKLGAFLKAVGADRGDFVTVDASDRDAGFYAASGRQTFWDPQNQTLPHFHQAFTWAGALAVSLQLPVIFWQVPVGNAAQGNQADHWKDNRVDYFFAHTDELVASHVAGAFFGAGARGQTTPESDGGNLIAKMRVYAAAPRAICP